MAARTSGFRPSNITSRGAYSAGKETTNEMVYDLRDSDPSTATTTETNFRRGWHRYGEAFFRSIGLQFINTFLPWGQDAEFPKIAIEKNRWTALIRSLLHIPPLIGCVVLLVLTFMTTILQPNSAFSILQFAAKLHEILMQASIAAILLSHVRYEITKNGQVPFGSLFAPAQISSIGYVWSPEMAGTIKSKGMSWFRKSALVFHILFAITLAAAVGPSSAILIIPRPIHPMLGQCTVRLPTDVDTLYPSRLSLDTPGKANFSAVGELHESVYAESFAFVAKHATTMVSQGVSIYDTISLRTLNRYEIATSVPLQLTADAIIACGSASWSEYNTQMSLESKQPFVLLNECVTVLIFDMNSSSQLTIRQPNGGGSNTKLNITLGEFNDSYQSSTGTLNNESTFRPGIISTEEAQLLAEPDPSRSFTIDLFGQSLTGYALESIPVFLATTVICLYCMYVLISIFISIIIGIIGISSSSWDSVSEITALALNSTPPSHLGSISAGLSTLRVFQELVGIFTNEKDGLELVFREGNVG